MGLRDRRDKRKRRFELPAYAGPVSGRATYKEQPATLTYPQIQIPILFELVPGIPDDLRQLVSGTYWLRLMYLNGWGSCT